MTQKIRISGLQLPPGYKPVLVDGERLQAPSGLDRSEPLLTGLSTLNVLIGPNNSGKSRLLRHFFLSAAEDNSLVLHSTDNPLPQLVSSLDQFEMETANLLRRLEGIPPEGAQRSATKALQLMSSMKQLSADPSLAGLLLWESRLKDLKTELQNVASQAASRNSFGRDIQKSLPQTDQILAFAMPELKKMRTDPLTFKKVYVPSIRTARPLPGVSDLIVATYFEQATIFTERSANGAAMPAASLETGHGLVDVVRRMLLGEPEQRQAIVDYQHFLSDRFFGGSPVTLIPKHEPGNELFVRIGEEERPLYDLGDGVQQLIILTFPLFSHRDENLLLFIEEPELYLHKGMQRVLVDTIVERRQEGAGTTQVFVSTHSSQFLDITIDQEPMSVYRVAKRSEKQTDVEPTFEVEFTSGGARRILHELGIRNSSVMLSNCTIWVEGITDRMYYRKYLELLQGYRIAKGKQLGTYLEDTHFAFVEYGGANIEHWSFLSESGTNVERLCGKLLLVADGDDQKATARHSSLKEVLEDRYHRLSSREVENLLAPDILLRVVAQYEGCDVTELETYAQVGISWADYKDAYLGEYIEDVLLQGSRRRRGSYRKESGTIVDKSKFAERAIRELSEWSDVGKSAQSLTRKMLDFIENNNPPL